MRLPIPLPHPIKEGAYLNTAAVGLLPEAVIKAQLHHARALAVEGEAAIGPIMALQEEARAGLARLVGAEPGDIGFVATTSHGMDLFAQMGAKGGRDRILCPKGEFPSTSLPWLGRDYAVQFITPREGAYPAEAFAEAMDDDVFAIVVSAAQFSDGTRTPLAPLAEVAHAHGALLIANITQAAGLMPLNLARDGVDLAVGTGHKWLLSGFGNGFIVAPRATRERLKLPGLGWLSVEDPFSMDNANLRAKTDASRVELGAMAMLPRACLHASLGVLEGLGADAIFAHGKRLSGLLRDGAAERGLAVRGGKDPETQGVTVLMEVEEAEGIVAGLKARGVQVSHRAGGVRVSPFIYNSEADIARFFRALDAVMAA